MNTRRGPENDDSIWNHRLLLPLPPIARPVILLAAYIGLYCLLVFPLSGALLGDVGRSTAAAAGMIATLWTWYMLHTRRSKSTAEQRILIYFAVSVLVGVTAVGAEWAVDSQRISNEWGFASGTGLLITAGLISGFVIGVVGIPPAETKGIEALLGLEILGLIPVPLLVLAFILGLKPAKAGLLGWKAVAIIAFGALSAQVCALAGWHLGRRIRSWLGAIDWAGRRLRALGPPLGLFVAGYLFMGLLFGSFHASIWQRNCNAYSGEGLHGSLREFVYFSFVTIATVGYGDIYPVSDAARLCTVAEIIFGQMWTLLVLGVVLSRLTTSGPSGE